MKLHSPQDFARYVRPFVALVTVFSVAFVSVVADVPSATSALSSAGAISTTPEARQAGWTAVSVSSRGVMVDYRDLNVSGAVFRAIRLRARTTLLRWHVGSGDPNAWAQAPADAAARIDWRSEGPPGVVAVFNGAFKQSAHAGGAVVDGVVMINLVVGSMTIALDRAGHWEMGPWGAKNFPTRGFHPISYRQNLTALVLDGALTPGASSSNWHQWGSPLNYNPLTARTGLGVDAHGNLIYVATMTPVMPVALASALLRAGAVTGMQLDINPFWPIAGVAARPLHTSTDQFALQLPASQHNASIYDSSWQRDFFVALAEPNSWLCSWTSAGVLSVVHHVQPQPLRIAGRGCRPPSPTSTPTTTAPTSTAPTK
jgi:hypothetical protein